MPEDALGSPHVAAEDFAVERAGVESLLGEERWLSAIWAETGVP